MLNLFAAGEKKISLVNSCLSFLFELLFVMSLSKHQVNMQDLQSLLNPIHMPMLHYTHILTSGLQKSTSSNTQIHCDIIMIDKVMIMMELYKWRENKWRRGQPCNWIRVSLQVIMWIEELNNRLLASVMNSLAYLFGTICWNRDELLLDMHEDFTWFVLSCLLLVQI